MPFVVNVAAPVPPLVTDKTVERDNEVALAAPRTGVTSVGELDKTTLPVPVEVVTPVPPLATAKGVLRDKDVALAAPKTGVTSVGEFASLLVDVYTRGSGGYARSSKRKSGHF